LELPKLMGTLNDGARSMIGSKNNMATLLYKRTQELGLQMKQYPSTKPNWKSCGIYTNYYWRRQCN
jgi:hypothetical protein